LFAQPTQFRTLAAIKARTAAMHAGRSNRSNRKQPQATASNRKQPQATTSNRKQPQVTASNRK